MTRQEELRDMLDKVTPGPWRLGSWQDNVFGTGPNNEWLDICRVKRDNLPIEESRDHFDAYLIAQAPTIAAELVTALDQLADAKAEIKRLREETVNGEAYESTNIQILLHALEKIHGYNLDIALGKINYRPKDHMDIARNALTAIKGFKAL